MDLKPIIWISSVDHLEEFDQILKDATFKEKFFYNYPMSDDFSRINKQPLVYFSQGELIFQADEISYQFNKFKDNLFNKYFTGTPQNLKELSFELKQSDIKSIEWHDYKHPRAFLKWQWIRIICDKEIMDGDFLICVDGRSNTQRLFKMLNQFKDGLEVKTSLKDLSNSKMFYVFYSGIFLLIISIFLLQYPYGAYSFGMDIVYWGILMMVSAFLIIFIFSIWCLAILNESSKFKNRFSAAITLWIMIYAGYRLLEHFIY